jgi:starch-binding outer membrane protein, SusD/RagB family
MKKINNFIIILVSSLIMSSCEGFLETVPTHSLTDASAISDFSKAKAAVAGVYSTFMNDYWSGGLYCYLATKSGFFNASTTDFNLSYTQLSGGNASCWGQFYKSLNAANFAINGIPGLSAEQVPSEAERSALIAEARCLRAWINVNILWNFGHWWADDADVYGILYRDKMVDMTNVQQPRITVGESYKFIYEDLDYAIANMKDFTTPRYMSKQFAKALKAKVLLYRGAILNKTADLQAALTLVNDVIATLPATCAMESDMAEVYNKAWDSKENLFVKYLDDDGSRTSKGGYWYTYGVVYTGFFTALPLSVGGQATAGLLYGFPWFSADPRWLIETGSRRRAETWDTGLSWTWSKLYRLGSYQGKVNVPIDEKYATYWFRYPELLLLKAELLARTGAPIAQAIAPINLMRSKRTNPVLPALNPASQDELMDMIFKETVMELVLENGSEFFASLRFQKNGQPYIVDIKSGKPLEWNKVCWPIPDAEMVNNQLMVQNPDLK